MAKPNKGKDGGGESFMQLIARAYHEVASAFEREAGMSQARLALLSHLRQKEELSQSTLQQRLNVDGAAITRQVKQLETEGLVARRAAPDDHRFTLVSLTTQGRKLADQVVRRRDAFEAKLLASVPSKDVVAMNKALERLREAARPRKNK